MSRSSSTTPRAFAASCALRSATFWSGLRAGNRPRASSRAHLGLEQLAAGDDPHAVEQHAFLVDRAARRRHRARRAAADVGVVRAARDEVAEAPAACVEHRRHDGQIGQVRAAVVRRVQQVGVAGCELLRAQDALHAVAHRAQVHGHVRRVRDQRAVGSEQRARKIQSLLDVDRVRRVLEHDAHLLGDVHEEVVEHLEHDRIGVAAERLAPRAAAHARQQQSARRVHARAPARLDNRRGVRLDDERGPGEARAGRQAARGRRRGRCASRRRTRRCGARSASSAAPAAPAAGAAAGGVVEPGTTASSSSDSTTSARVRCRRGSRSAARAAARNAAASSAVGRAGVPRDGQAPYRLLRL